jgi:hypothetical protein
VRGELHPPDGRDDGFNLFGGGVGVHDDEH